MPTRLIKESCRTSKTIDTLSDGAEAMFYRLTTAVDDYGRFRADPEILLAACYPLRIKRLRLRVVASRVEEMRRAGLVVVYEHEGVRYLSISTFQKHQGTARAKSSRCPEPPMHADADTCMQMSADARGGPYTSSCSSLKGSLLLPDLELTTSKGRRPPNAGPSCAECQAALEELNRRTGRHYTGSGEGLRMLHARHQEHGSPAVLRVIRVKVGAWLHSQKWSKYLRPETLFRPTKFDGYLNEPDPVSPGPEEFDELKPPDGA